MIKFTSITICYLLTILLIIIFFFPKQILAVTWIPSYEFNGATSFIRGSVYDSLTLYAAIQSDNSDTYDLLKTDDFGESWTSVKGDLVGGHDINWISLGPENTIAISLWGGGIYTSPNMGANWNKIFTSDYPRSVEIHPQTQSVLYVGIGNTNGSPESGLYKTTNGGANWSKIQAFGNQNSGQISIDQNSLRVYAGADPNLFKSADNGTSWNLLPLNRVYSNVLIDKNNESVLYASQYPPSAGIYKSVNEGSNWTIKSNGINSPAFRLAQDQNGNLFASRLNYGGGLWMSRDGAETWENIQDPAWGTRNTLGLDVKDGRVFVGVEGLGIYYADVNVTPPPPPTANPVVFLPGLGGSWSYKGLVEKGATTPDEWILTPLFTDDYYQPLLKTLKNSGLVENQNLFVFAYDWRQPVASSAQQLKTYLQSTVESQSPGKKANIVGHSLGGIVAIYCYEKISGCADHIDKLITGGSPVKGALGAYKFWEGGVIDEPNPILRVIEEVAIRATGGTNLTRKDIVQANIPSVKDILPIFNYIDGKPYSQMSSQAQNPTLMALQAPSDDLKQNLKTLSGLNTPTDSTYQVSSPLAFEQRLGLWTDGKFVSATTNTGDGTVLATSSSLSDVSDEKIPVTHTNYFSSNHGLATVLATFSLSGPIEISGPATDSILLFLIHSPAKIKVYDGSGVEVGININQQAVFVKNPSPQTYTIQLEGTGTGSYKLESYFAAYNQQTLIRETGGTISSGTVQNKKFAFVANPSQLFTEETITSLLDRFNEAIARVPGARAKIISNKVNTYVNAITNRSKWLSISYDLTYQQNELSWLLRQQSNSQVRQNLIAANYFFWDILNNLYHKYSGQRAPSYVLYQVEKADRYIDSAKKITPIWNPVAANLYDAQLWQQESRTLYEAGELFKAEWISRGIQHLLPPIN